MLIVVCIKQVPAEGDVKIDVVTKNLARGNAVGVMNPYDRHALEAAVGLKEKYGAKVVAISMGPPQFSYTLREALAKGADEAFLLSSPAFAGADTLATSYVLAKAIEKLGHVDLVLLGRHAVDADSGQVGPIVAEYLDMPQATLAKGLEMAGANHIKVTRLLDSEEETVKVKLPAVVTVTEFLNKPRYALPLNIMQAAVAQISILNEKDLECDPQKIGMSGSRTQVTSVFAPPKSSAQMLPSDQAAPTIAGILRKRKLA